jgi:uncharacterized iron-regulated membrane protein
MKLARKTVFWLHLTVGLVAGVLVLIMSVTGVLMAYERQITDKADGFRITATAGTPVMEPAALMESLKRPAPSSVTFERDPDRPVTLQYGREKTRFVDPRTGADLGEGNVTVRKFFKFVLGWHRWLGRDGASQPVGKAIIGIGNMMFLFLVVSGIFLWFPKRWTRSGIKAITLFQKRLKGRARDWNWHNVLGFWTAIPLLVVVTCGTVISQPWATALVFKIAGETPPARKDKKGGPGSPVTLPSDLSGLDAAFTAAKSANPEWQSIQLQLPFHKHATFVVADSHRGRPDKRRTLTVDLATAAVTKSEGLTDLGTGRQARTWIRWIHTGEAGGLPGQTVAGLAAVSSGVLVWTGFALSWRRFTRRRIA